MSALSEIKLFKNAIEKLSKWELTDEAFGHIETIVTTAEASTDPKADYIYEFFCASRVLEDLSHSYLIMLEPSKVGKEYKFPQKPALKKNCALFLLRNKKTKDVEFQISLGTKIKISIAPLSPYAPDISVQTATSPEYPDERHVVLIMDAKYKSNESSKLDISTIREFAKCASDLQVPKSSVSGMQFNRLTDLSTNCLFTNGGHIVDHGQYCTNNKIRQVSAFDCDGRSYQTSG